ncbi:MAG: hypothetical protein CL871_04085 [Cytophagia bacterium]|nr:hypothetical protein [Cytophagia bacterium]|tara:strand:- start:1157 stop:1372 length:216 start_codon:yes stop_codon:yes gene_type:complete
MIYSISLSGLIVVFTVLLFVFFVGKQLILITNKFSTNLKNEEKEINKIIDTKISDISEGKGKVIKITKIDS